MSSRGALPARLLAVLAPVWAAGLAIVVAAGYEFATTPRDTAGLVGIAALFLVVLIAERHPVPVDEIDTRGVSLGVVFAVSAVVLFGWEVGALVWVGALVVANLIDHRPMIRMSYNAAMFAIGCGRRPAS